MRFGTPDSIDTDAFVTLGYTGGRFRAQAQALLASLGGNGSGGGGGSGGASEVEALAAAMAALNLAAKEKEKEKGAGGASGKAPSSSSSSGKQHSLHRTLLERLGDLDGGREAEGFGIARVPPTGLAAVRAKPPLFDMAYTQLLETRLPDLGVKAGLPPSAAASKRRQQQQQAAGSGGGGLFGWLRG